MPEEEWLSTGEFLMFAGGNQDRSSYLLGYVAAFVPPDVLYHAVMTRKRFEEAGATWRELHNWAIEGPYKLPE